MGKKYWKGLEELNGSEKFVELQENEFAEKLPSDLLGDDKLGASSASRRDFLKFLGFSTAAAALASCETPVTKTIPYIIKPEQITPGVATWYASTYFDGYDFCSMVVKTREGRPIKIESNTHKHSTTPGTNARVQASVLSLYDSERLQNPIAKGQNSTWDKVDSEIGGKLGSAGAIRIISSTVISPSFSRAVREFMGKYPNTKHVMYDAVSCAGMMQANWSSFGKKAIPSYNFENANVIVSFGADFLANWISPIEFAGQYAKNRRVSKEKKTMSKHVQFETLLSLTGSNADVRVAVKPSEMGANIVALYNAVAGASLPVSGKASDQVGKAAEWLKANKGKSLVVCGINDASMQMMVNEINNVLGNYEHTIDLENPCFLRQGDDSEFAHTVGEMKDGKVGAVIFYNCNPAYTAPASLGFADALKKVGLKITLSGTIDETSRLCDYTCPDHHPLESWSDAMPKQGRISLGQPTIAPLFKTRSAMETLLKWSGNNTDAHAYIQQTWAAISGKEMNSMDFSDWWNKTLHDGVSGWEQPVETKKDEKKPDEKKAEEKKEGEVKEEEKSTGPKEKESQPEEKMNISAVAAALANAKGGGVELVLYEKTSMGTGNQSNNPWLQELPDPVSKVTWDNYVTMNPADMQGKYNLMERAEWETEASVVEVSAGGVKMKLPVYPQPGQTKGTIGIALGYGRTSAGKVGNNVGQNAFAAVQIVNGLMSYSVANATITDTTETFPLAATQIHHTMMGRKIVNETSLKEYNEKSAEEWNEKEKVTEKDKETGKFGRKDPNEVDLWTSFDRNGHRWGMAIDLNSCIGCNACVVSCTAENNVPVVGKMEVRRSREMHWLRIDRYYSSDMTKEKGVEEKKGTIETYREMERPSDYPEVVFQPVMCQHCNHAPCETVCPVIATSHSSEGLNQMIYNRCIGTRYCANNCPYKVRRFNWFEFDRNSRFTNVNPSQDDLGRMVLNPDVVVRSRGVMEKCSMCVQRIQAGKLKAKMESRKITDGEFTTACAQSCPTNAITFGDMNDEKSKVSQLWNDERQYRIFDEQGFRTSVFYLTKVRNTEMEYGHEEHEGKEEKHEEKKEEKKES